MYEAYKEQTDKLIASLVKNSFAVTVVVLIVFTATLISGTFDWRMLFLLALPIYYWLYVLATFLSRQTLLNELKENLVETKTITLKSVKRNDRLTYVGGKYDRGFSYGVLRYKIKDTKNLTYYFEDVIGGSKILPEVKPCGAMKGKIMTITCTKKTRYIVSASFTADKDTNFFKQEMMGYFE